MEVVEVISRELDRQERIANRPDYRIDIGKLAIKLNLGQPLKPHEIKILTASQTLTEYLLEVANPFGEFGEFADDEDFETTGELRSRPECHRIRLPDISSTRGRGD